MAPLIRHLDRDARDLSDTFESVVAVSAGALLALSGIAYWLFCF